MESRKNISTILITDIVGYSKLSGDNQEVALELLKEHDKILFNSIDKFNGTMLKNRGDGVIAQFNLPVDSIKMAVHAQRQFERRNSLNVKSRNLNVRIGVHYGEYLKEGEDIHGECINIASKLEPEAPSGGIVISKELCYQIIDINNIYIREFKKIFLNDAGEMTYEVYLDLIGWYHNKKNRMSVLTNKKNILEKAQSFYSKGDYSTALKFSVLAYEKSEDIDITNINSLIINHLVSLGEFKIADNLLNKINLEDVSYDTNLKAHILKLQGHLLFNNEKWSLAKSKYQESLKVFKKLKSKYSNEILFYILAIDVINDNKTFETTNNIEKNLSDDDYCELSFLATEYLKNKTEYQEIDSYIDRIENFKRHDLKAYAYWLVNKLFFLSKDLNQAFIYETKAQENIKLSSKDISDVYMREIFLNKLILNKIIISEATIEVDDLFDFEESEDEDIELIIESDITFFNYCVKCGKENIKKIQECDYCDAFLFKAPYDKK